MLEECKEVNVEIYVGNLPFSAQENDLMDLFSNHGSVRQAKVIIDRESGRSKGFAFVSMDNADEAKAAIEAINGHEMDRRNLVVNEARERTNNRGPRQGGGDRGGYNRGGNNDGGRGGYNSRR
ncbi:MAG: RNA-binding protein [Candidatus Cloacimonetes bacterium]|nr:RNA-binding protein [Candidatus Cloacimonadota bacterium]